MSAAVTIGKAAQLSSVPANTICYYEESGLLPPAQRGANGYRVYGQRAVGGTLCAAGAQLRLFDEGRGGAAHVMGG